MQWAVWFLLATERRSLCILVRTSFAWTRNVFFFWSLNRSSLRQRLAVHIRYVSCYCAHKQNFQLNFTNTSIRDEKTLPSTFTSTSVLSQPSNRSQRFGNQWSDLIIKLHSDWKCVETCSRCRIEKKFAFDICETRRNIRKETESSRDFEKKISSSETNEQQ